MTGLVPLPSPGFDDLSIDEKIDYLQALWERIAASSRPVPVLDWHREILDQRFSDLKRDPDTGDSWDVVQERLRKMLNERQ